MNILERLENYKLDNNDHPDIAYLKSTSLGGVVTRALSDLYKVQPKNPVTFLANWLMNESRSNQIKLKIQQDNIIKEELKEIYKEKQIELEKQRKEKEAELKKIQDKKLKFLEKIKSSKDIEVDLNSFCNDLESLVNATGVYVSILDKKRKDVTEDEDENAHLIDQQVIRYVNFSESHKFLQYKFLENEQGITYDLFKPKEENSEAGQDQENANAENMENAENDDNTEIRQEKIKEYIPNHILVEEVVRNPKMKFFREPRIGCYLAIDLTYKSSLLTLSLNSAIEALNDYNNRLADYDQRKNEFLLKQQEELAQREQQEGATEGQQPNSEQVEQNFPEENITLNEFEKTEKKYILSLDTMGQDRLFTEEEKKYIFEVIKTIKESWELLEKNLLLKDRDLKIQVIQKETNYRDPSTAERLEADEEKFIKDYFQSERFIENPMSDEREKQIETDLQKAKFILSNIFEDPQLMDLFSVLNNFEVYIC